jgi:hypothetical protein
MIILAIIASLFTTVLARYKPIVGNSSLRNTLGSGGGIIPPFYPAP